MNRNKSEILTLNRGERAVIIGTTGSGKSTLARAIIGPLPYLIIVDPKGDFKYPGAKIVTTPRKLIEEGNRQGDGDVIIYRPEARYANPEGYDQAYKFCYLRKECSIYTDELSAVCDTQGTPTEYLGHIQQRGRSLGITAVYSTQRPSRIPLTVLSEATWYYTFALMFPPDRKRVCDIFGLKVMPKLEEYQFAAWCVRDPKKIIVTKLKKG